MYFKLGGADASQITAHHLIGFSKWSSILYFTNKQEQTSDSICTRASSPGLQLASWNASVSGRLVNICCNQLNRPEYPNITVFQDAISRQCLETFSSESRNVFGRSWNFPHFPWRWEWLKGNWCALNWLANDRNPKELFQWVLVTTLFSMVLDLQTHGYYFPSFPLWSFVSGRRPIVSVDNGAGVEYTRRGVFQFRRKSTFHQVWIYLLCRRVRTSC